MASDYISREAAIKALCKAHSPYPRRREISVRAIQDISPADVKPVVRGKWKHDGSDWKNRFICDQCGYKWFFEAEEANYCPNCGCAMEDEK